jgi:hypothetical protein
MALKQSTSVYHEEEDLLVHDSDKLKDAVLTRGDKIWKKISALVPG